MLGHAGARALPLEVHSSNSLGMRPVRTPGTAMASERSLRVWLRPDLGNAAAMGRLSSVLLL